MKHTHTTRRWATAVATVAMIGTVIAVPRAEAAPVSVRAGEDVTVAFGTCTDPQVLTVSPERAGVAVYNPDTTVRFTAAPDFGGLATVSVTCASFPAALQLFFQVELGSVTADATFTPRPAPGPCITLTLSDTTVVGIPSRVRFGDVIVGQSSISPTRIAIGSCTSINQGISAAVSEAISGTGPSAVVWNPNVGPSLSPNQFRYELDLDGPVTSTSLDTTQRALTTLVPVQLATFDSQLTIAPGSSTGIGQPFTATLTFLAVQG